MALLAYDFHGRMPGGPADRYTLVAMIPHEGLVLTTNTAFLPSQYGGFELGNIGTKQPFGVFIRSGNPPLGVVDMRARGVRFQAQVQEGSLHPKTIEQAAYNNLTLAVIDVETRPRDPRRRHLLAPKPKTFQQRIAASRRLASDKGPVQLPSWSTYVSPAKPRLK